MTTTETWGAGSDNLVSTVNSVPAEHAGRVTDDHCARRDVSNNHTPHTHQRAIPYDGALNEVTPGADITARSDAHTAGETGGARNYGVVAYNSVVVHNRVGENGDVTADPDARRYCDVRVYQGTRADLDRPGKVGSGMDQGQKAILGDGREQVRTAGKVRRAAERVDKPGGRILQRRAQRAQDRQAPHLGSPLSFIIVEEASGAITQTLSREFCEPLKDVSPSARRPQDDDILLQMPSSRHVAFARSEGIEASSSSAATTRRCSSTVILECMGRANARLATSSVTGKSPLA